MSKYKLTLEEEQYNKELEAEIIAQKLERVRAYEQREKDMKNGTGIYADVSNLMDIASGYLKKTGLTKSKLADAIGVSRSLISQYMNGNYRSNTKEIEQKITDYFKKVGVIGEDHIEIPTTNNLPEFIPSNDAINILGLCKNCQDKKGLGVIIGASGYGKTWTLKQYAKQERVAYIECEDSMRTPTDLVTAIERAVGLPKGFTTHWGRVEVIKEFFRARHGYILILDEADKLIQKTGVSKAEILRAIYDQSPVGLILAGEPALQGKLESYLPRLANRIDYFYSLNGVSKKEVFNYLDESGLDYTTEAKEELYRRATNSHTGCFRLLARTIKNILEVTIPGQIVDINVITQASSRMML